MPVVNVSFRLEKEKMTALIAAGATYAANSTVTLNAQVEGAQAHDWTNVQIAEAFTVGRTVSQQQPRRSKRRRCDRAFR